MEAKKTEAVEESRTPESCAELLQTMPKAFSPSAAEGLSAVYQFEVTGGEEFTAHIRIENGTCSYAEGPAASADVLIKTPADVWLAISTGAMDGQMAFMTGKFTAEGDLSLLLRLQSLFPG